MTTDTGTAAAVGTWASQQAYRLGQAHGAAAERERLRDPQVGYDLGYDVGYSANLEQRGYVHAVRQGFEAGNAARQELAARVLDQARPPQRQPELEPEAG
jgi:hypothetical protein